MGLKQKNVGIIGCGMIGHKRAMSLDEGSQVSVCCDIQLSKAKQLGVKTLNEKEFMELIGE